MGRSRIKRVLNIVLILFAFSYGTEARYLFDAARIFPLTYAGAPVQVVDVSGDGIVDVVTARIRLSVMVGAGDGTFSEVIETTGVLSPTSMATGDFNGDGFVDVALGDDEGSGGGTLRILLGNGDGTFYSNETYVTVNIPRDLDAGDVDGDGDLDLVTVDNDYAVTHLNDGDGIFGPGLNSAIGTWPVAAVLEDFNDDGDLDLAVLHKQSEDLHVCAGNGDGTFAAGQVIQFSNLPQDLAVGDLNDDGTQDLVVTTHVGWGVADLHILLGDGAGGFSITEQYDIDGYLGTLKLARMDGDPFLDIVVDLDSLVTVLPGNGDGTIGTAIISDVDLTWDEVFTLGDMDRDGDRDVVLPMPAFEDGMMLILNRGDGTMQTAPETEAQDHITWTAAADLDQNGSLDVVLVHDGSTDPKVTSLLNDGDGSFTFAAGWQGDEGDRACHCSAALLNDDNIPDLALSLNNLDYNDGYIAILIGNGDGTFFSPSSFVNQGDLFQSHLWLVNGDAHVDLVAAHEDGVWVALGQGDANFDISYYAAEGGRPTMVDAADLDGDGTLDLVFYNSDGESFSVIFGDGSGGFSSPTDYPVGQTWLSLNLGDLDDDGDPDLVYSIDDNPHDTLCVRLNNGSGVFLGETVHSPDLNVINCRLADITADGRLDAVSTSWQSVTVHPGLGDGGFGEVHRFGTFGVNDSLRPAHGDFDGDGDLDLVVGRDNMQYEESVLLFRNTSARGSLFAAGPGRGEDNPSQVRTFTLTGTVQLVNQWQAYGVSRYGVNVALGELDGSQGMEVLTGPGPGPIFGPHVRGFEDSGVPLPGVSFLAYGTNKWGVNVAVGDIDADGYDEIVTGAGPGAVFGPHVRGWNWDGAGTPQSIPGISYFAYGTPKWGVNVSCGDIDGDGFDEIVTGAGPGAVYGPHIRGWNCDGGGATAISGVSFFAYGTLKFGVNVACGDIDGDGIDEIVTGAGPGVVFGPHVRGWNWDGAGSVQAIPGISYFAYEYSEWGVNVGCGDLDGDGIDEILTGPGPGPTHPPRLRGWNYDGTGLSAIEAVDFDGFDSVEVTHGIKPAGLRASHR